MPNIADYDNVVVDTHSLSNLLRKTPETRTHTRANENFLRKILKNQEFVRERLIHLLHSGGDVYAICSLREFREISTYSSCDNYDWSPFAITMANESGETINVIDNSFSHYFQFVKKWSFYFEEPDSLSEIEDFYRKRYYIDTKWSTIAQNRYTRPIAIAVWYATHQLKGQELMNLEKAMPFSSGVKHYIEEIKDVSSKLFLLPMTTEVDDREAINIILEDFWGIQQKTPPPEGIDEVLLPGEAELKKEIKKELDKIDQIKTKIIGLEERNKEITQFKQLIYETGDPLEDICKTTLSQLGYKTDDSVEDFILTTEDKEAIVEVKGRERSILREDGAQLAQNRRNYAIQKGKGIREIKAILLGNPWRLVLPLEERARKEPFSIHLADDSVVEDMALVTTVELLKAYSAFLVGKISKEEIIKRLFSGIGLTKLVDE